MPTSHLRKKIKFSKDLLFYINIIFKFQGKHVSVEKKSFCREKRVAKRKQAFHDGTQVTAFAQRGGIFDGVCAKVSVSL